METDFSQSKVSSPEGKFDSKFESKIESKIDSKNGWKNVKVAMLVRTFSAHGGLELYTYKLVQELLKQGLLITVICEEDNSNLNHEHLKVLKISPSKPKANKVARIEHYIKEFTQAVEKYGPFDIVHSQHLGARNVDVVTFHNHTINRMNLAGSSTEVAINKFKSLFRADYIMRDEVDAMLAKRALALIFPSRVCKQDFVEHFRFHEKKSMESIMVAYPGWQMSKQSSSTEAPSSINEIPMSPIPKEKTILFVGRGYRKKGLDVLLSACVLLKKQNYSFRLLIAGLEAKPLDKWQLNACGLAENVSYLGFVKDMDKLYHSASIIAVPSRMEPFGMAALQAMSYGLVPVVSKVSGVSELLQANENALLIENHLDSKELAKHLSTLFDKPQVLATMSDAARAKAHSITWQTTVDTTLNAYQQVFQRKYII